MNYLKTVLCLTRSVSIPLRGVTSKFTPDKNEISSILTPPEKFSFSFCITEGSKLVLNLQDLPVHSRNSALVIDINESKSRNMRSGSLIASSEYNEDDMLSETVSQRKLNITPGAVRISVIRHSASSALAVDSVSSIAVITALGSPEDASDIQFNTTADSEKSSNIGISIVGKSPGELVIKIAVPLSLQSTSMYGVSHKDSGAPEDYYFVKIFVIPRVPVSVTSVHEFIGLLESIQENNTGSDHVVQESGLLFRSQCMNDSFSASTEDEVYLYTVRGHVEIQ